MWFCALAGLVTDSCPQYRESHTHIDFSSQQPKNLLHAKRTVKKFYIEAW